MKNRTTSQRLGDRLLRDIFLELIPGLPRAAASSLGNASKPQHYEAGDLIIREGEPSNGIFVLTSGTVQTAVSRRTSEAVRQITLLQIAAPAVLGVTAAMLAQSSAVSVLALTRTEGTFIARADLLHVLGQFPQAGIAFSKVIASELAHTYLHLSLLRGGPRLRAASIPAN